LILSVSTACIQVQGQQSIAGSQGLVSSSSLGEPLNFGIDEVWPPIFEAVTATGTLGKRT